MENSSDKVCIKRHQNSQLKESHITLLNWNVHKNNYHYKWLHDFDEILRQFKPNIISFQEYQTMGRRSIIDKHADFAYGFFPNIAYKQHMYGLLTASTVDIDDFIPLSTSDVEPFIKTPKVSFVTSHRMYNGEILSIINVHMINFVKIQKYIAQVKQIEALCNQSKGALILTGDFNTWSKKRMRILLSMTKRVGLESAFFEKEDHKKPFLSYPLDHIFYKGLLQVKSKILKDIETSDHKPMVVTFHPLS
jgi:endonuclease/exonuclease/phosphatase (EEP) superfamily protein YafD